MCFKNVSMKFWSAISMFHGLHRSYQSRRRACFLQTTKILNLMNFPQQNSRWQISKHFPWIPITNGIAPLIKVGHHGTRDGSDIGLKIRTHLCWTDITLTKETWSNAIWFKLSSSLVMFDFKNGLSKSNQNDMSSYKV